LVHFLHEQPSSGKTVGYAPVSTGGIGNDLPGLQAQERGDRLSFGLVAFLAQAVGKEVEIVPEVSSKSNSLCAPSSAVVN
jgi:hypothetical protein